MNEAHTTDNQLHDLIQPTCEEYYDDDKYGTTRPYDGWAGFPGSGDGQDDLADYNAMEGGDY